MSKNEAPRPDTTRLQGLARAYCQSAVFFAAIDLELFTHIEQGTGTIQGLAKAIGIHELNVERLVNVCIALGLIERVDGELRNAADTERFLVKGERSYAAPWMTFTRPTAKRWFDLTELLRNPEPPTRLGEGVDMSVDEARAYHQATYSIGMGAGRRFCRQVDLSKRKKLLDLGGGSGAYSINAVKTFDGLEAVVFDLPGVVVVTREFAEKNGVADRVSAVAGDFTKDPFPSCDAVVMASNLPMYNQEAIQLVVQKAFDCLEPGGCMHLIGETLDEDGSGPLDAALWGMQEVLRNSEGRAHRVDEVRGYFEHAGFEQVADFDFVPGVLRRITGRKPESQV